MEICALARDAAVPILMLFFLLVACLFLLRALLASLPVSDIFTQIDKTPKTGTGLVQQTKARWKGRPLVSGAFFCEGGIPGLEGSDDRKGIEKTHFPLGGDCL